MRLADNEAVFNQLSDVLSAVGCANLRCLVGVEPNLLLSAFQNRRRQANRKVKRESLSHRVLDYDAEHVCNHK